MHMSPSDAIFIVFALITVGSAAVVTLARSLIYSAFSLLFTFFGVAGLYLLLGADFIAAAQLLIYVGGILVLLLFGVMLTHKLYDLDLKSEVTQFLPALIVAAGLFLCLAYPGIPRPSFWKQTWPWGLDGKGIAFATQWAVGPGRPPSATTAEIGHLFMGQYLLPFEAASILLLVALMGAAMIVRRKKEA
jgi:NADH-quinone oxidoreductase subunit J